MGGLVVVGVIDVLSATVGPIYSFMELELVSALEEEKGAGEGLRDELEPESKREAL